MCNGPWRMNQEAVKYKIQDAVTGQYFHCNPDQTLLFAMERSNLNPIAVGCRGGGCGLCKIRITKGDYVTKTMSRRHVSAADEGRQYALACRSFPRSDLIFETGNPGQ